MFRTRHESPEIPGRNRRCKNTSGEKTYSAVPMSAPHDEAHTLEECQGIIKQEAEIQHMQRVDELRTAQQIQSIVETDRLLKHPDSSRGSGLSTEIVLYVRTGSGAEF